MQIEMKRIFFAFIVLLALSSCARSAEPFFFVQITDTQMGFREKGEIGRSVSLLTETVAAVNRLHPAFVVVTGDMVNAWADTAQLKAYKALISQIDKDIPVYEIPGNHDFRPLKEEGSDKAWFEHFGTDRFCFTYGDCLIVGFNSCYVKDGLSDEELREFEWLESCLEGGRKAAHRFLFCHCSIIREDPLEEEDYFNFQEPYRQKYLDLCSRYGVDAVFSGHYHRYRRCTFNGTEHVTCTASGTPLGDGFTGINIVTVHPDRFESVVVPTSEAVNPLQ